MTEQTGRPSTAARIRAELITAIENYPPITYDLEGIHSQRAGGELLKTHPEYRPTDPQVRIYDRQIAVAGNSSLRLRIAEPTEAHGLCGGVLWLHGGGMTIGLPESDDGQSIRFVKEAGCVVISPDYRLAPENPYPIPLDDCFGALLWLHDHAAELNVDPNRIAVAGLSGGGGLALAVALRARDSGGPKPALVMAITPMINRALDTPSAMLNFDDPRTLSREGAQQLWGYYLGDTRETDIYMEPLKDDFHGMPPVYAAAGEIDPFRDDTILLAQKLMAQNVPTELHIYPGVFHGSDGLAPAAAISIYQVSEYVRALKEYLG